MLSRHPDASRCLDAHKESDENDELPLVTTASTQNALWQGIATEVLNPKTALFFLSFIPQFVSQQSGHIFLQFLILGTISVTLNTGADLIVITMAGPIGNRIRSSATFRRPAADYDWYHHDRTGDVAGNQRNEVMLFAVDSVGRESWHRHAVMSFVNRSSRGHTRAGSSRYIGLAHNRFDNVRVFLRKKQEEPANIAVARENESAGPSS